MFKKVDKLLIFTAIIVIMLGISLVLMNFANTKINAKSSEKMNTNYSTTESNTWDVSKTGDRSVIATLSEDGTLTISGTGEMKDWKYNDTTDWHGAKNDVKSVIIGQGIASIGKYAFYDCESLTSIQISNSVTSIGMYAFCYCKSLTKIIIPDSVTSIGTYALDNCESLMDIEVAQGNTRYMDVDGVLYTKDGAEIKKYPEGREDASYTILSNVKTIGYRAFYYCKRLTGIEIPNSVTAIGDSSFEFCENLTNIIIPNCVTSIGNSAFKYCKSLTSIEIPNSVTSIGYDAFYQCTNLTNITIPDSVTSIGNNSFWGCEVTQLISRTTNNIEIPNILKRTQDCNDILYSDNSLQLSNCIIEGDNIKITDTDSYAQIYVPGGLLKNLTYVISYDSWDISKNKDNSVTATLAEDGTLTISGTGEMKDWNYNDKTDWHGMKNNVKSVIIEQGITTIGKYAIYECKSLINIEIPDSVTSIKGGAFTGCSSLIEIHIPNSITRIEDNIFSECSSLTEIEIPNSVTSIGSYAFRNCKSLTEIYIPNSVKSINYGTFYGCKSLNSIEVDENNTTYMDDNGVLHSKDGTVLIIYPQGKKETQYTILTTVEKIDGCAFHECENLINIEIPNSVTSIGWDAFAGCSNLITIEIPNSVSSIGSDVFTGCKNLKTIEVDENNKAFKDDNGVLYNKEGTEIRKYPEGKEGTEYTILSTVTSIGNAAFYGCETLTYIKIPDSVTSIGNEAFYNCKNLTDIEITYNVGGIGYSAFDGCSKLKILCYKGSYVEEYAAKNNIQFETLEKENPGLEIIEIQFDDINLYNKVVDGAIEHLYTEGRGTVNMSERILNKDDDKLTIQMKKQDITFINYMYITSSDIQSINGIEKFFNLEQIWASNNEISDISPISNLTQLQVIDFEKNQINDISALQNLEKLTTIYLGSNFQIESIDSVKNLTNLKSMDLTGNLVCDISPLINLTNLEELYLGINSIKDVGNIGNLTNLKTLVLSNNEIEDISELSKLTKLEELYLGQKTITPRYSYSSVENHVSGNKIKDISCLKGLTNLKTLGIECNNINDISPIEELALENLYSESQELYFYTTIEENGSIEIDLPKVFIDSKDENSIAYTNNDFILVNCELNENGTKIIADLTKIDSGIYIQINGGILDKTKLTITMGDLQVNISEYNVNENNFITNIALETPIKEFVENIDTNGTIEIYKGTQKITDTETNIGTGMTVRISFNNQEAEYTVVVKGDINGDGNAKLSDLSKLKLSVIGTTQLEGAYKEAADINGDGNVKLSDLSKMKLYLVGKGSL